MKNFKTLALSLLALSLILNLALFSRMGSLNDLERSVNDSNNRVQSSINLLNGQVNHLLNQIEKEQRWITPAEVDFTQPDPASGETTANLKWQIKEYDQDARVTLYYRLSDKADFTAVPVESKSGGYFEAAVPLKVTPEPYWDINISTRANSSSQRAVRPVPVQEGAGPADTLAYYVSVEKGGSVKSSEIQVTGLEKLSFKTYGPLTLSLNIDGLKYNISLFEHAEGKNRISGAALRVYSGENLVAEKPLAHRTEPGGGGAYTTQYERSAQAQERLVVNIRYDNGSEFQKDITAY
ncbi:MAG: hypothetical protein HPY50_19900 [Firmicutes bacterium]|nr:hypothetical protein [Bacillota bacterium]